MKAIMEMVVKLVKAEVDRILKLTEHSKLMDNVLKAEEELLVLESINLNEVLTKKQRISNSIQIHEKKKEILEGKRKLFTLRK